MIRVAIIDDHPLATTGLANMLVPFPHIRVTGTYQEGQSLLDSLAQEQPDVLLLDIQMPEMSGEELALAVRRAYPAIRMLVVTSLDTPGYIRTMIRSGCSGYILKNTGHDQLRQAIEEVYAGREFIEPTLKEKMVQHMLHHKKSTESATPVLTKREKEILNMVVAEMSSQEIADKLFLSLRTVENHRFNIHKKLRVSNPYALVKTAIEMGLIEP